MSAAPTIPFEAQSDPQARRDCGAACLSMVYRSFGKQVPRDEIWAAIARPNRSGSVASTTHLMVRDALARGFAAVAIQARHPLQALRLCCDSGVRAILNLRLAHDSADGHYTVLVDMDDRDVILHDPFRGPMRRVPQADLLDVWQPRVPNSEILGNLLIGIAAAPAEPASCWLCHTTTPASVPCPYCGKPAGMQPDAILGCSSRSCVARVWHAVCCPSCDCVFTFHVEDTGAADSRILHTPAEPAPPCEPVPDAPPAPTAEDPFQLAPVFAEMDKFIAQMSALPGLAEHAGLKQQLEFLAAQKDKLKLAQANALASQVASHERWAKLDRMSQDNQEAHRKRVEELNQSASPLDGDALGRALMKNLGFIR
ncbi:MAG TPA: cysteine peptidase family C39 domain-containing protein [Candidatus Sulfopaludibacter sp.]|nr:cysteine peptidase family C39 domain-containing protein [Candidatus Sulfopaludibacter sp.]